MNYTNYERKIVERFSIALTGWPFDGPVKNPANLGGRAALGKLLNALESETCTWVKLTATELAARVASNKARQARGEQVYRYRKRRQTARDDILDDESSVNDSDSD